MAVDPQYRSDFSAGAGGVLEWYHTNLYYVGAAWNPPARDWRAVRHDSGGTSGCAGHFDPHRETGGAPGK